MSRFSLAATAVDVTPPAGSPLAGYGARGDAVATGCHDPLEAGLCWLRDESTGTDVVWVALDVVGVDADLAGAIAASVARAVDRPEATVLVCASHTHSSAALWFRRPTPALDIGDAASADAADAARAALVDRIAAAAEPLPALLRPVRLVAARGEVRGVGANRHRPDGPHDASAGVLAARDEQGRVTAVLTDHGNHPTVLGHGNLRWSADWPGAARRALAGALAGVDAPEGPAEPPVVLFLQGAAGCSSARFVRREQTFAEAARIGGRYAAQVLDLLLDAPVADLDGPLVVARTVVELPTKATASPAAAAAREEQAKAAWEAVRADDGEGSPAERLARTRYEGAAVDRRMAGAGLPPTVRLPLTVVAIGDLAWLHVPAELFASFGLRIRARSPFAATRVVGYTDDYVGYLADADAHRDGVYEAGVSMFDAAAGDRLCLVAEELLAEALLGEGAERARVREAVR